MIVTCGVDHNNEGVAKQHACGKVFDDAECMTICPHPKLNDPTWRKQIDDRMRQLGYRWSLDRYGYVKA